MHAMSEQDDAAQQEKIKHSCLVYVNFDTNEWLKRAAKRADVTRQDMAAAILEAWAKIEIGGEAEAGIK